MRKSIQQIAFLASLLCAGAYATQDPAISLQQLQTKEQEAVKQLERISLLLSSNSIPQQDRQLLEQRLMKTKKELASIRQSIALSKTASSNEMASYSNE